MYYTVSEFRRKCETILNHTRLYEYKHGKMLIHLKFCLESVTFSQAPTATLRYYRLRKDLSTRQLAEAVGIVLSTVLMYEREQIPYQAAVIMADVLEIDKNLLSDDFARFIGAPYFEILRSVRKEYNFSQKDFADKAGIAFSIYAKWENGSRQPSRKMYHQLVAVYPELKV